MTQTNLTRKTVGLLGAGVLALSTWQLLQQPLTPVFADPNPATSTQANRAEVYYIDQATNQQIGRQTLFAGSLMVPPSGYRIVDPTFNAIIQNAILNNVYSTQRIPVARQISMTITTVDTSGNIIARTVVSGDENTIGEYTIPLPDGYVPVDGYTTLRYQLTQANAASGLNVTIRRQNGTTAPPTRPTPQTPAPQPGQNRRPLPTTPPLVQQVTPTTQAAMRTGMIVVRFIDDGTGLIINTRVLLGPVGAPLDDQAQTVLRKYLREGYVLRKDPLRRGLTFTAATQTFEIHLAKRDAMTKPKRVSPKKFALPADRQKTDHADDPKLHPTPWQPEQTVTPLEEPKPSDLLKQTPVTVSRAKTLPDYDANNGGGDGNLTGLAAYFVSLSGRINFGVRAGSATSAI